MTTYGDLVAAYVAHPEPSTLAALRDVIRSSENFRADLSPDLAVGSLAARGQYDEVVQALRGLLPGAMLSPFVHAALAEALAQTGQPEASRREASLARLSVRSITSTGDGTLERPWSVLRLSDEYDVLRASGKRSREQSLVEVDGRSIDRHICEDGSTVHFDVTDFFERRG